MNNENRKVSDFISEVYKGLPLKMRTRINMTANELLEIQKKNKALIEEGEKLSSYENGKNMK